VSCKNVFVNFWKPGFDFWCWWCHINWTKHRLNERKLMFIKTNVKNENSPKICFFILTWLNIYLFNALKAGLWTVKSQVVKEEISKSEIVAEFYHFVSCNTCNIEAITACRSVIFCMGLLPSKMYFPRL